MIKRKGIILIVLVTVSMNIAKSQTNFIWGKQSGTDKEEYVLNHVTDRNGNIYISGKTTGVATGQNFGKNDGFITKIDSLGNTLWSGQFGTTEEEDVLWSAIDLNDNVYITGSTGGAMNSKNSGKEDIFVVKYNSEGKMQWARQFGTDSTDTGSGIYTDRGGFIYVTGSTNGTMGKSASGKTDAFIMKLDPDGNILFTDQFGTKGDDYGVAITGDGNSLIFVCGSTWGDLGAKNKGMIDAFVCSFSDKGELLQKIQFGSEGFDMALQITADDKNNIYVGGSTSGDLAGKQMGEGDCFLYKINSGGSIVWTEQFGTKAHDGVRGLAFNRKISDNILVSGIMNLPPEYAFIRMYKDDGSLLWEKNFAAKSKNGGTSGKDVTIDNNGNIYHLGLTGSNLFGSLIGGHDYYLLKISLDKDFRNH
jgi:hypothetical protein